MKKIIKRIVNEEREVRRKKVGKEIVLKKGKMKKGKKGLYVEGKDMSIGKVVRKIIENER